MKRKKKRIPFIRKLRIWRSSRYVNKPRHPRRPGQNRRIPRRYIALVMVIFFVAAFAYGYYRFDRTILPLVLEAAELKLQTDMNNVIFEVIQEIIRENRISASDFYTQRYDATAGNPVLSVNTILVNNLCNEAALRISERLNNLDPEIVSVPMGMAFKLDTLSQVGPRFNFVMAPIGNALVSYDSRFSSVGINQVHFSVSLTVEAVVRIINPVHSFVVEVNRHVSLVDTIISGVVPETYLNLDIPR
jgi:sporulation protein YunB